MKSSITRSPAHRARCAIAVISLFVVLGLIFIGCGSSPGKNAASGDGLPQDNPPAAIGSWKCLVDIDHKSLDIIPAEDTGTVIVLNGHTVEMKNGPAGCTWDGPSATLTCEVMITNLAAVNKMFNVRTRLHNSTNSTAILKGADYTWPGPAICNGTAPLPQNRGNCDLPINESGFCFAEDGVHGVAGEGCNTNFAEFIPPGGSVSTTFKFTNVPAGQYTFFTDIFADYDVRYNWTWMSGGTVINQNGVYGTRGTPDPANVPGCRLGAVTWIDASSNLWLFGGAGYAASAGLGYLNDLWKWDGSNWTWVSGSDARNQWGNYGTKGTPAPTNVPGGRNKAVSWRDSSGNFWLFGGNGYNASTGGYLNDLWKWDGTYWTWISGSNLTDQYGTYGTKGTPAPANVPGGRYQAVSWINASGNFWLFGGYGYAGSGSYGLFNDLWKWDGTYWTWISGSNATGQFGTYGTKGTPAPANVPGCREEAVSWIDASGNLWLFGGSGYAASGGLGDLNDLWRWNGTNWTWISGSNATGQSGTYGTKGTHNPANVPGARYGAISWIDSSGNLWLFGGYWLGSGPGYLNDLWKWDGTNWTWISGSNAVNQFGTYGTKGAPAPANAPGGHSRGVTWIDSSGNLWLFGGQGYPTSGASGYLNDLWRFH